VLLTIKILGWLLARFPLPLNEFLATCLGNVLFHLPGKRRHTLLLNLHHAFPEKPESWRCQLGLDSCRRTVEMAMLLLALPFLSHRNLLERVRLPKMIREKYREFLEQEKPAILLTPHFSLFEYITMVPSLFECQGIVSAAIFRPLNNPKLNAWIQESRERHGVRLLSRNEGFSQAQNLLSQKAVLGILPDQNAGASGILNTFFGRVCSTTQLPALLAKRHQAETYILHARRTRFWHATIEIHKLQAAPNELPQASNDWLEEKLRMDPDACRDWLWLHDRWRANHFPTARFRIYQKRVNFPTGRPPGKYRLWIRMSNWLGDVVMSLPLIAALRQCRPDIEITLLSQPAYIPLFELFGTADSYIPVPSKRTPRYFQYFQNLRLEYPDTHLLLTNSTRGDLEARHIRAPQRYGLVLPGKPRPFLTHHYTPPEDVFTQLKTLHQTRLWEQMLRHFGLEIPVDTSPLELPGIQRLPNKTGIIAGSSNNAVKCWPVDYWVTFLREYTAANPGTEVHLYGTQKDRSTTAEIAACLGNPDVYDHAGQTNLSGLAKELASCSHVIGNDTGGMHLANAVGTPVTLIYGPTNPLVTGPISSAPAKILQPPGCPPTGGAGILGLEPQAVLEQVTAQPPGVPPHP
jgi:heptosyltransferase-2